MARLHRLPAANWMRVLAASPNDPLLVARLALAHLSVAIDINPTIRRMWATRRESPQFNWRDGIEKKRVASEDERS